MVADGKFSKELKQWRGSGDETDADDDDDTAQYNLSNRDLAAAKGKGMGMGGEKAGQTKGHKRNSSEYSGDWVQ